jgi:subtilisin-like proprotein convertase family protein
MRKICSFLLPLWLLSLLLNAQVYHGSGGTIPDNGNPVSFPLVVSGLTPSSLSTAHGLAEVKVNIVHPYDADLYIALISPDGASVLLSVSNGGDGDNYTQTRFSDTASVSIAAGIPPFNGVFKPQELLGNLNNGRQGNGTWHLYIHDLYAYADEGTLLNWSITFDENVTGPFVFESSNLPIVLIDTYGQEILDDPKIQVGMKIIDNGPGERNFITDTPVYNGYAGIEIRGSSSQMFPKKSYGFETWDIDGEEIDVSLLGMPAESDWILNANYTDKTLARNAMAYQLSQNMGHYSTRYKYVEVVINEMYKGIYVFSEKIKRDPNRVNIAKLKPDQNSGDELTGGYIFKVDKFTGSGGDGWISAFPPPQSPNGQTIFFQYEYPKADDITIQQKQYISDYVNTFEAILSGPDFNDSDEGFRAYADEYSFIDYFLVNEISKNVDGYRLSTFLHKQRESLGGKIRIGPVWDYDIAWHNANYCGGDELTGWAYQFPCPDDYWQVPFWWQRMLQDTLFANNLRCRWEELRVNTLSDAWFETYIDSVATLLDESQQRNFTVWPILGVYVWPNPWPYPPTYAAEIESLKNWIFQRLDWIDANLPGNCYSINNNYQAAENHSLRIFPNPAHDYIHVVANLINEKHCIAEITDKTGRIVATEKIAADNEGVFYWHTNLSQLGPGIYFVKFIFSSTTATGKFVKK